MITRDLINKNIKYSAYDSTDIIYDYAYVSREIDRFKNILLKYKAEPGMTVYNFLRGVNCVALFFACSELGIITALTDVTWQTMKMYFDKRDYIDAKTKAISPIHFCFVNDYSWNKIQTEDMSREKMFHEIARMTIKYDDEADYTPNNQVLATDDSVLAIYSTHGEIDTPKPYTHTHGYIEPLAKRNASFFNGGVMATRRFHHGSSFATFFLPSLMSSSVERMYYVEQKNHSTDKDISFNDVDHIQYPYTDDIKKFLRDAKPSPHLTVHTLSQINSEWKKHIGVRIKDMISIFGRSETSGPILIQKLSDEKFQSDRYIDPDGYFNPKIVDGILTLTGDSFERNDDGSYKLLGRDFFVTIKGKKINVNEINKKANEIIDQCHVVFDKTYNKVYVCIWKQQDNLDEKILELTLFYRHLFIISKWKVITGKIKAGNKLDNESIRDYFRREDKLV